MSYCQELNLPAPLKDAAAFKDLANIKKYSTRSYAHATKDVSKYINHELLDIFNRLNVEPTVLILFGHGGNVDRNLDPRIHTDICLINQEWIKVPFAINWELTQIRPTIKWWNTLDLKEIYPYNNEEPLANGIHYGRRDPGGGNRNIKDFQCLHSHNLTTRATLIRTDLPHSVEHTSVNSRFSVSIRFNLTSQKWEDTVNLFKYCKAE